MYKSNYGTYLPVYHTLTVNDVKTFFLVGHDSTRNFRGRHKHGSVHTVKSNTSDGSIQVNNDVESYAHPLKL
jgi:hypothetical protein